MADDRRWPTMTRIEALIVTARLGSWERAAEQLGGKDGRQPWRLVRQLAEYVYGSDPPELFERIPKDQSESEQELRLTPAGKVVYERAQALYQAACALRDLSPSKTGPLSLGCFPAHVRWVAGLLDEVELKLLDVDDRYRRQGGRLLIDMLHARSRDVVIAGEQDASSHVESLPIYDWHMVVVTRRRNGQARAGAVRLTELAGEPLLLSPSGHSSRDRLFEAFDASGLQPMLRHESRNTEALLAMADAGCGSAVLPCDAVWPSHARRLIRPLFEPAISGRHALHWRLGDEKRDDRVARLIDVARRHATVGQPCPNCRPRKLSEG